MRNKSPGTGRAAPPNTRIPIAPVDPLCDTEVAGVGEYVVLGPRIEGEVHQYAPHRTDPEVCGASTGVG